jgi:hypothetical protein
VLAALLLLGATTALHLEEAAELPLESALEINEALRTAIAERIGARPALDDPTWTSCQRADRCLREIEARTGSDEVVYVRVYGGPLRIRLLAERISPSRASVAKVEISMPREREKWAEPIAEAAKRLYPEPHATAPPLLVVPQPQPPAVTTPVRVLPWVTTGVAIASGVAAVAFGQAAVGARDQIQREVLGSATYQPLADRMQLDATLSNVFLAAALAGVAGAALLFLTD